MKIKPFHRYILMFALTSFACVALIMYQLKNTPISYVQDKPSSGEAELGGPFVLTDQYGKKRDSQEFKGKLMLIYFGYSFCPDICPTGLQNITGALNLLKRDREQIVPLFVTVDPKRDTSDHLKIYASNFHPNFIMLTGTKDEIKAISKLYKVYAAKSDEGPSSSDYLIDHSTLIYLMDQNGKFLEYFPHSTPPEKLSWAILKYLIHKQE
jgi:cytochrome oxidase Cu insertion factor (SCO1/SenC/PrrC family)